ncbi:STAS domain-containing protein [Labedaea rhizosphaerae]|uniref:STAS domain-containing protein n=1 Tax=Labedaea rhizosphaerae TaxID=598644 RepID=UPI001AAD1B25|nr:STAS domain-containing protein [Labedaea rhizosphaerae]
MSPPSGTEQSPEGLHFARRLVEGTVVVAVAGEVDLDTAPDMSAAVLSCIDEAGGGPCVLDLTEVTFLDSAGLTVLLKASLRAERHEEHLRIVVDSNRPVIRPIEVTRLDEVLTLYHTVDEALAADREQR